MGKRKKVAAAGVFGVAMTYGVIAVSPLTTHIGRSDPALASLFRPLHFNFSSTYDTGRVLDFHIGMARDSFFSALESAYTGRGEIKVNCEIVTARSLVPMTPGLDVEAIYGGGDRFCAYLDPPGSAGFEVYFQNDVVSRIEVWYVRGEGT